MIKFLLDALNNCNSNKAKYIKSLYYRYCQFIYNEVNDSIYNNEEIFAMFLGEFFDLNKISITNYKGKLHKYIIISKNSNSSYSFMADRSNEHTVAHLRSIISNNNKWNGVHKQIQK